MLCFGPNVHFGALLQDQGSSLQISNTSFNTSRIRFSLPIAPPSIAATYVAMREVCGHNSAVSAPQTQLQEGPDKLPALPL